MRGIIEEEDRESLLNGLHAVEQEGRRNINGSTFDMLPFDLLFEESYSPIYLHFLARARQVPKSTKTAKKHNTWLYNTYCRNGKGGLTASVYIDILADI